MGDLRVELRASVVGEGPSLLLVHGSAVDQNTWSIQRSLLHGARKLLYDRRGASPSTHAEAEVSVEQHAEDAAELLRQLAPGEPVVACGSSFGGVVVLELIRAHPDLVRHAVILEPPLPPDDETSLAPLGFMDRFEVLVREEGGPAAGEYFLRSVLGDEGFERIAVPHRAKSAARWESIRRDCLALAAYRVRFPELRAITTPVLLVGGEKSAGLYGKTLHALHAALGNATLEFLPAGHMMHAEAHKRFNARLMELLVAPR